MHACVFVCVCVCVAKPVGVELRCHATALIIISDTILVCLTSCFVLFCLPSIHSLLSFYHSMSVYLLDCLPVLRNLYFGIDFGRNDPGQNRPTYLGRNDPPQNWVETTQAETTQGRNDPDSTSTWDTTIVSIIN